MKLWKNCLILSQNPPNMYFKEYKYVLLDAWCKNIYYYTQIDCYGIVGRI